MANYHEHGVILKKLGLAEEETSENAQALKRFRSEDVLSYSHDNDKRY